MDGEQVFSITDNNMEFENETPSLGGSIFNTPDDDDDNKFVIELPNENTNADTNHTENAQPNQAPRALRLNEVLNPEAVARLLAEIEKVVFVPTAFLSQFARSLIANNRRVRDLHKCMVESNIYLPGLECKRVTYAYLLGITEGQYIAVKALGVRDNGFHYPLKVPTRVLKYEIDKIAKLRNQRSGYHLSRGFSRFYYVQVLYQLNKEHSIFGGPVRKLIPDEQPPRVPDPDEVVEELVQQIPMPETFRGLIRFERSRLRDMFYANLFGGAIGMEVVQRRLASLQNNVVLLRRVLVALRRDMRLLNNAIVLDEHFSAIIDLIVPD
jgi:hypothetical protein